MRITWTNPGNVDIRFTVYPGEIESDNGITNDGSGVFIGFDHIGVMIEGDPTDFIYALLAEGYGTVRADQAMNALIEGN